MTDNPLKAAAKLVHHGDLDGLRAFLQTKSDRAAKASQAAESGDAISEPSARANDFTVDSRFENGDTLLHHAARAKSLPLMKLLIEEFGADPAVRNDSARQALHECIEDMECVRYIAPLVDPDALKHGTWTPIMTVSQKNLHEQLSLLLSLASPSSLVTTLRLTNKSSWTALHLAAHEGQVEAMKVLLDAAGGEELRREMLTTRTNNGMVPLLLACSAGRLDAAQFLHGQLASVSTSPMCQFLDLADTSGLATLECSVVSGNTELVRWCVRTAGADAARVLQHSDVLGRVGMHHAALVGNVPVIEELAKLWKESGCGEGEGMVGVRDDIEGWTPLHYAAKEGHVAASVALLKLGADRDVQDKKGRTPVELARAFRKNEVADCIEGLEGV